MKQFIFHLNDADNVLIIARELRRMADLVAESAIVTGKLNDGWKRLCEGHGYATFEDTDKPAEVSYPSITQVALENLFKETIDTAKDMK